LKRPIHPPQNFLKNKTSDPRPGIDRSQDEQSLKHDDEVI